jgi:GNAT superfamily N-acetyltransferase
LSVAAGQLNAMELAVRVPATGVPGAPGAMVSAARELHAVSVSQVTFATLGEDDIRSYLDTGEWDGKAGAYAIQGMAQSFISHLSGSHSGVMGLPLHETACLLRDMGHWEALGYGNWAVRETATGDYVGSVGVLDYRRLIEPALDAPELGWGVAPRFQGRGMAFEALSAALAWCDETLNAPRTVCMISPDNVASHVLAAKAGFKPFAETTYKDAPVVPLERSAA